MRTLGRVFDPEKSGTRSLCIFRGSMTQPAFSPRVWFAHRFSARSLAQAWESPAAVGSSRHRFAELIQYHRAQAGTQANARLGMKKQRAIHDIERTIELDFVRATEAAALNVFKWIGKGEKNKADGAACDAIEGMFDLIDACGTVSISEGIKDEAPRFDVGKRLGQWRPGSVKFDIAIDPIDGTTNLANGLPNSISVLCAASPEKGVGQALKRIPSFYSKKIAYGPQVKNNMARKGSPQVRLNHPIGSNLMIVAKALNKRIQD